MAVNREIEDHFGFFSVVSVGATAYIGGFLVLNAMGRPLEFHCTEAVKPTRAQEILYGNTLQPFVYVDQIGKALINASKIKPTIMFVDSIEALEIRGQTDALVFSIRPRTQEKAPDASGLVIGNLELMPWNRKQIDIETLSDKQRGIIDDWDLLEPFQRIQNAIQETAKAA